MAPQTTVEIFKLTNVSADAKSSPIILRSPPLTTLSTLKAVNEDVFNDRVKSSIQDTQETDTPDVSLLHNGNALVQTEITATNHDQLRTDESIAVSPEPHVNGPSTVQQQHGSLNDQNPQIRKPKRPAKAKRSKTNLTSKGAKGHERASVTREDVGNIDNPRGLSRADLNIVLSSTQVPFSDGSDTRPVRAAKASALMALKRNSEARQVSEPTISARMRDSNVDGDTPSSSALEGTVANTRVKQEIEKYQPSAAPKKARNGDDQYGGGTHNLADHASTALRPQVENVNSPAAHANNLAEAQNGYSQQKAIVLSDNESSSEDEQVSRFGTSNQIARVLGSSQPAVRKPRTNVAEEVGVCAPKPSIRTASQSAMPPPKRRRSASTTLDERRRNAKRRLTVDHQGSPVPLGMTVSEEMTVLETFNTDPRRRSRSHGDRSLPAIKSDISGDNITVNRRRTVSPPISSFKKHLETYLQTRKTKRATAVTKVVKTLEDLREVEAKRGAKTRKTLMDCIHLLQESDCPDVLSKWNRIREKLASIKTHVDQLDAMIAELL